LEDLFLEEAFLLLELRLGRDLGLRTGIRFEFAYKDFVSLGI
jgi:hypothetical protein